MTVFILQIPHLVDVLYAAEVWMCMLHDVDLQRESPMLILLMYCPKIEVGVLQHGISSSLGNHRPRM